MWKHWLVTALLLTAPLAAQEGGQQSAPSQTESQPIITDRPDQAESPYTVGSGRFQIESGLLYERARGGDEFFATPTLLRFGTGPNTELRLESDFITAAQGVTGLSDTSLGAKVNLVDEEWGAIALLGRVNLPSGTGPLAGNAVVPELALLTTFPLNDSMAIAVSLQGGVPEDEAGGGRYLQGFFATSLGFALTDELGMFVECFGSGPDGTNGPFELAMDGGFTYLLNEDLQIDLAVLKGMSGSGLDWGMTVGVSARY